MRFEEMDLEDAVLDGLYDMNFDEATPVQELTIPIILEGKDVIACAQTGTGKTAAYVLPVINELSKGKHPADAINAVIMAPTRELAQQIDQQIQGFYPLDFGSGGLWWNGWRHLGTATARNGDGRRYCYCDTRPALVAY